MTAVRRRTLEMIRVYVSSSLPGDVGAFPDDPVPEDDRIYYADMLGFAVSAPTEEMKSQADILSELCMFFAASSPSR